MFLNHPVTKPQDEVCCLISLLSVKLDQNNVAGKDGVMYLTTTNFVTYQTSTHSVTIGHPTKSDDLAIKKQFGQVRMPWILLIQMAVVFVYFLECGTVDKTFFNSWDLSIECFIII